MRNSFEQSEFKAKMFAAWGAKPPRVQYRAEPMPGTPHLRLLGEGSSTASLDDFLLRIEANKRTQKGKFFTYPVNSDKLEEDTYILEGWEIYTSIDSCYDALVILYYSALYPYQVIKKYMGEEMAQEYYNEKLATLN